MDEQTELLTRTPVEDMTDRELLIEVVTLLRGLADGMAQFQQAMNNGGGPMGMLRAILSGK